MTFQFKYPTPLSTTYNGVVYRRGTIHWFLMEFGKLEKSFYYSFQVVVRFLYPRVCHSDISSSPLDWGFLLLPCSQAKPALVLQQLPQDHSKTDKLDQMIWF